MMQLNFRKNIDECTTEDFNRLVNSLPEENHSRLYGIYLDLRTGEFNVALKQKPRSYQHFLFMFRICDYIDKPTNFVNEIKRINRCHNWGVFVCYTTIVHKYGKKFADTLTPTKYARNPHYRCAGMMKLYDERMVTYMYNNYKLNNKKKKKHI